MSGMDHSRFQRYEEHFVNSLRIVDREISIDPGRKRGRQEGWKLSSDDYLSFRNIHRLILIYFSKSARKAYIEAQSELLEAEGYLHALDLEFRLMVSAEKSKLHGRLKSYREDYQVRLTHLHAIKQEIEGVEEKNDAVPNQCRPVDVTFDIQGGLRTNALLDRSTNSLEQSRQIVANTEIIGKNVISDLESQREQLLGAKENLSETKDFAGIAKRLLRSMGRKALMQKFSLIFTIISLFAVICLIIYFGLAKKF